jgi:hypothetical protein
VHAEQSRNVHGRAPSPRHRAAHRALHLTHEIRSPFAAPPLGLLFQMPVKLRIGSGYRSRKAARRERERTLPGAEAHGCPEEAGPGRGCGWPLPWQEHLGRIPVPAAQRPHQVAGDGHGEVVDLVGGLGPGFDDAEAEQGRAAPGLQRRHPTAIVQVQVADEVAQRAADVRGTHQQEARQAQRERIALLAHQQPEVLASGRGHASRNQLAAGDVWDRQIGIVEIGGNEGGVAEHRGRLAAEVAKHLRNARERTDANHGADRAAPRDSGQADLLHALIHSRSAVPVLAQIVNFTSLFGNAFASADAQNDQLSGDH